MTSRRALLPFGAVLVLAASAVEATVPPGSELQASATEPLPPGAVARLGSMRLRHGGGIRWLGFSPDGRLLGSASADGTIIVWDASSGAFRQRILGDASVSTAAFSADGATIFAVAEETCAGGVTTVGSHAINGTGGGDGLFEESEYGGASFAASPHGRWIAWERNHGGRVEVRVRGSGGASRSRTVARLDRVDALAASPDAKHLAVLTGENVLLLDPLRGRRLWRSPRVAGTQLAFLPGGRLLALRGNAVTTWLDVATGRPADPGPLRAVWPLAVDPDQRFMAVLTPADVVTVWDMGSGAAATTLGMHLDSAEIAALSPDAHTLAVADGPCIRLFDLTAGAERFADKARPGKPVLAVSFSPDGSRLATGDSGGDLMLWDVVSRRPIVRSPAENRGAANALAYSSDGLLLAVARDDGTLDLWTGSALAPVRQLHASPPAEALYAVAFSSSGREIAAAGHDGRVRLCNVETGGVDHVLDGHVGSVLSVAFLPDERRVVSGGEDATMRLWDATTGRALARPRKSDDPVATVASIAGDRVLRVTWCTTDGGTRTTLRLFRIDANRFRAAGPSIELDAVFGDDVRPSAVSSDGRRLAVGDGESGGGDFSGQGAAYIVDVEHPARRAKLTPQGGVVNALAFSPSGALLAVATDDSTVLLFPSSIGASP